MDWFGIYFCGTITGLAIRLDGRGIDRKRKELKVSSRFLAKTLR